MGGGLLSKLLCLYVDWGQETLLIVNLFHTESSFDISCHTLCPRPYFPLCSHLILLENCDFCSIGFKRTVIGIYVCMCACAWSWPSFWTPMDCGLPGSSVHGIFQVNILEWVAISYSLDSSWPRDWNSHLLCLLYKQVDSLPLHHLGSPKGTWTFFYLLFWNNFRPTGSCQNRRMHERLLFWQLPASLKLFQNKKRKKKLIIMYIIYHGELKFDISKIQLGSVQLLSCVQLFATPWTAAQQASLSITNSWSLLKLMTIGSVMPSNHLILCRPLLLPPSIFTNLVGVG